MGPWLATTIAQCDGLTEMMSYWTFSDVFEEQGVVKTPFYGGFGLIAEGNLPKPSFYALELLHRLGEQRIENSNPDVLVTKTETGTLQIAVWNIVNPGSTGAAKTVKLAFKGVAPDARVAIRRLDANDGDTLALWQKMGSPRYPTQAQLEHGSEQILPIIARGVLLDIAAAHSVPCLPESYGITVEDCQAAAKRQGTVIREGDVVLLRTGRMQYWPDGSKVFGNSPGVTVETANWLTKQNIVTVGADNEAVEVTPSGNEDNWLPGHCHFLTEAGVPQIECLNLEELSHDKRYEFAFIGAPIRLRGSTGSPIRPLAFPLKA